MFKEGDHVAYMNNGAFGEYQLIQDGFSVPDPNPEYIPLMGSGLTAALALEHNGVDVFQKGIFFFVFCSQFFMKMHQTNYLCFKSSYNHT